MNTLITLAEAWWPLYATHMIEVSLFILLVWAVDRWLTLETRLRYALYLLALAKVFVPPVLAIPIPEFLVFIDKCHSGCIPFIQVWFLKPSPFLPHSGRADPSTGVLSFLPVDAISPGLGRCGSCGNTRPFIVC